MPNFKKDRSKFTMKGFSPFNSGTPYKQDDKPVPKIPMKNPGVSEDRWNESSDEEKNIMIRMDKVEQQMEGLDPESKKYKDLMSQLRTLDNQMWQYD